MNSFVKAALILLMVIICGMVVLDIVVLRLKSKKVALNSRIGVYFRNNLFKFNAFVFLLLFCIVWMIPLVVGVLGSFTSQYTFTYTPGQLVPDDGFTFDNYLNFFNKYDAASGARYPVERWMLNSFIVSAVSTVLYLLFAGLSAYAFVFMRFKFRNALFLFMLFTMVIPGVATMTPQIANVANLGISKSLLALILPGLGGVGGLYLIRQFFLGIPKDLIESAHMDGASNFRIFFRVVLPVGKSVFFVQGLFCFMGGWNDLLWPQVILGTADMNLWTLQVGIAALSQSKTANSIGLNLASAMFSAVPIILLYIFMQNKIIEGVASSGVKG